MITQAWLKQLAQNGASSVDHLIKWDGTSWIASTITASNIINFNASAQAAVGNILVDSSTIDLTYNAGTPSISGGVITQLTVTSDASGVRLVNDVATPGNNKIYGTNGAGTKGWFDSPSGADGNGIYTGSGNIGGGAANVTTVATLGDDSSFRINYFDGSVAFRISDTDLDAIDIQIQTNNTRGKIFLDGVGTLDSYIAMEVLDRDGSYITLEGRTSIADTNITPLVRAILDVRSTTKMFLMPRMTTTQRNAITALDATYNSGLIYNTTTAKFNFYAHPNWVTLGDDGNGIYTGSGDIPAATNATALGAFAIRYSGGSVNAFSVTSSTDSTAMQSRSTANLLNVSNTEIRASTSSGTNFLALNAGTSESTYRTIIRDVVGAIDPKAILDVASTTLALFPPRMTTAQRDAMGATNNAALLYNTTTNKLTVRANGAWAEVDTAGLTIANGAVGRVPFFSSATALTAEDQLFYDTTNNRLGIGTATPSHTLDVAGAANFAGRVRVTGIGNAFELDTAAAIHIRNTGPTNKTLMLAMNTAGKSYIIERNTAADTYFMEFDHTNTGAQVSLIGAFAYRTEQIIGSFAVNQNNLAINVDNTVVKVSSSANINITGMLGDGTNHSGRQVILINTGANTITLTHQDAASNAVNRFIIRNNANTAIAPEGCAVCWYDTAVSRWRIISIT